VHLRGTGLMQQNAFIRTLCLEAIKVVETTVVTEQAWLELNRTADYQCKVLLHAFGLLVKQNSEYRGTRRRIKQDETFLKHIGKWVMMDRLAHARGAVKSKGVDRVAFFQLGIDDVRASCASALMLSDRYACPGHWGFDILFWIIKNSKIFHNSGLIAILKQSFFAAPASFGCNCTEHYVCFHTSCMEPEFSQSLVALATAGVRQPCPFV
ncbi:hypothetical protein HYPSUDRAFT_149507, partial [Hypholoma sublateritium FD-334 SS-4]